MAEQSPVGVLSQRLWRTWDAANGNAIAADLVKALEAAGFVVVPAEANAQDGLIAALREARVFIADELATSLRDACLIRDGKPDRSTMDEICAPYIEDCEARLARIDATLARARGETP